MDQLRDELLPYTKTGGISNDDIQSAGFCSAKKKACGARQSDQY